MKTDRERVEPFLADLLAAGGEWDEEPALLAAIMLRESGGGWAEGYSPAGSAWGLHADGHGHGLMGIDDRFHGGYCKRSDCGEPREQFKYACHGVLRPNREWLKRSASMPSDVKIVDRTAIAGYNCGVGRAQRGLILHGDPDTFTTRGNYSRWIMAKMDVLRAEFGESIQCLKKS